MEFNHFLWVALSSVTLNGDPGVTEFELTTIGWTIMDRRESSESVKNSLPVESEKTS